jgi:hypothetical protein
MNLAARSQSYKPSGDYVINHLSPIQQHGSQIAKTQ